MNKCWKRGYETMAEAHATADHIRKRPGGRSSIRVYRCPDCDKFHLTSAKDKR